MPNKSLISVSIESLSPGMMVTQVLEQNGPVKIRRVGMVKSYEMVKGLREMGVLRVEIDESQSIGIELKPDASSRDSDNSDDIIHEHIHKPIYEPTHDNISNSKRESFDDVSAVHNKSPGESEQAQVSMTQQLLKGMSSQAGNKDMEQQHAALERGLSQNFHRAMFMPALDEMPSKWRLYGLPVSITAICIILGFSLGFSMMKAPQWYAAWQQQSIAVQVTGGDSAQQAKSVAIPKIASEGTDSPSVDTQNEKSDTDNVLAENSVSGAGQNEADSSLLSEVNNTVTNTVKTTANESDGQNMLANTTENRAQSVSQPGSNDTDEPVNSVDGIRLEEGQVVLGYGGQSDELSSQEEPDLLSQDLLRRVNQAAAAIELEQEGNALPSSEGELNENALASDEDLFAQLYGQEPQASIDLRQQASDDLQRIDQLPAAILTQIPAMSFSAHMYASNQANRWVRVNGRRLMEGDTIDDGLVLEAIEPEVVVLSFRGEIFTMNALSDW